MAEHTARWRAGLVAYANQFRIREDEVFERMRAAFGEPFATEAVLASGGAWDEGALSLRDRSLLVLTALAAQGGLEERLRVHARWALDHGATGDELDALAALLAVYAGFPRASVAAEIFREVVTDYEPPAAPATS